MALEAVDWDMVARFAVALGAGGLIGLERERHHDEAKIMAGVRTLPLVALGGVLSVLVAEESGAPLVIAGAVVAFGGLTILMAYAREHYPSAGMTSPVAFFATFLLGVLAGTGRLLETAALAVVITLLLANKRGLHRVADVMTEKEMRGVIMLVVIAFIVYPLTPAGPVDPWGLVDLRKALAIVILVSLFSFLGFLALRRFGPGRGLAWVGFLGGLASSTAATAAIARAPAESSKLRQAATGGVLLAVSAMLARNLFVVAVADPALDMVVLVGVPLVAMAAAVALWGVLVLRDGAREAPDLHIDNPFALGPALRFGALFLLISLAARGLQAVPGLGPAGVYLIALGALVSGAAVVASVGLLVAQSAVPVEVGASIVLVAVAVSALVKLVVVWAGHRPLVRRLVVPMAAVAAASLAAALLVLRVPPGWI